MADYTKYKFNGKNKLYKNRLVLEVVRKYINDQKENLTFNDLKNKFDKNKFSHSLDLVLDENGKNLFKRNRQNGEFEKRYFHDTDTLKLNNENIYVNSEWGKDPENLGRYFDAFLDFAKKELGYDIEEINNKKIESTMINHRKQNKNKILNIIIYGVPGVGKTHNINKLIKLIEDGDSDRNIFDAIKGNERNDSMNISNIKERVAFVTFHQSFGYEDFIEGFRPNEEGQIELVDGIFKKLSLQAKENFLKSKGNQKLLFKDAIQILLKNKIENEETLKIDLKRENSYYQIYDYNERTIFFEKQNGDRTHSLSLKTLERMYEEEQNNIIHGGLAPYYNPLLEKLLQIKREHQIDRTERKNYYLVIDEINRGNISKIFGELITLIEEDKRDKLEVTLPYSKEKFSVPSNLFIIGTMNSTDKSIALIDVALRRRFTFLKMEPNDQLIANTQVRKLFNDLNTALKDKLGEDHQIGHSYFMNVQNKDDLDFVLEYKIKPLLEEYFYGDNDGLDEMLKICGSGEDREGR
jgi:5-methylcytosine-specific restriction protein B